MLLTRMSFEPKTSVGRTIACSTSSSARRRSISALPRKYGYGESGDGFETEMWTIRRTPASRAVRNSVSVFSTARSNVIPPCSKRIQ